MRRLILGFFVVLGAVLAHAFSIDSFVACAFGWLGHLGRLFLGLDAGSLGLRHLLRFFLRRQGRCFFVLLPLLRYPELVRGLLQCLSQPAVFQEVLQVLYNLGFQLVIHDEGLLVSVLCPFLLLPFLGRAFRSARSVRGHAHCHCGGSFSSLQAIGMRPLPSTFNLRREGAMLHQQCLLFVLGSELLGPLCRPDQAHKQHQSSSHHPWAAQNIGRQQTQDDEKDANARKAVDQETQALLRSIDGLRH
mmetsp:Transcript_83371/g.131977  ORF Transcript_83371/g.131977 Transcript_83371/m.131977 type:complete len:247 (+) Transcript_83371:289-1029(+)